MINIDAAQVRPRNTVDSDHPLRLVRVAAGAGVGVDPGVIRANVDLLRRTVRVEFQAQVTTLRRVVEQLAALGYSPALTADATHADHAVDDPAALSVQLGVAGFAFGDIMLFSIAALRQRRASRRSASSACSMD